MSTQDHYKSSSYRTFSSISFYIKYFVKKITLYDMDETSIYMCIMCTNIKESSVQIIFSLKNYIFLFKCRYHRTIVFFYINLCLGICLRLQIYFDEGTHLHLCIRIYEYFSGTKDSIFILYLFI